MTIRRTDLTSSDGSVEATLTGDGYDLSVKALPAVVDASALPTADPHVVGRLWNSAGTIKISAGP